VRGRLGHFPEGQLRSSCISSLSVKRACHVVVMVLLIASAWGKPTVRQDHISQPSSKFTIGPGIVIAVRALGAPFIGRCYTVKYKSDGGELIEVRHPRQDIPVLEGMYGLLTYSTNPEMILDFRIIERTARETSALGGGTREDARQNREPPRRSRKPEIIFRGRSPELARRHPTEATICRKHSTPFLFRRVTSIRQAWRILEDADPTSRPEAGQGGVRDTTPEVTPPLAQGVHQCLRR
jgi:hypothetical protein